MGATLTCHGEAAAESFMRVVYVLPPPAPAAAGLHGGGYAFPRVIDTARRNRPWKPFCDDSGMR